MDPSINVVLVVHTAIWGNGSMTSGLGGRRNTSAYNIHWSRKVWPFGTPAMAPHDTRTCFPNLAGYDTVTWHPIIAPRHSTATLCNLHAPTMGSKNPILLSWEKGTWKTIQGTRYILFSFLFLHEKIWLKLRCNMFFFDTLKRLQCGVLQWSIEEAHAKSIQHHVCHEWIL